MNKIRTLFIETEYPATITMHANTLDIMIEEIFLILCKDEKYYKIESKGK